METYIVQNGDTLETIASSYGISVNKLIQDNDLTDPMHLVPGEAIIIVHPSQTYAVQDGDTLETIASFHNISVNELLRSNPFLSNRDYIYPGEVLAISYDRVGTLATHGYTYTFTNRQTLIKTLPSLTYLSIFNYIIIKNGDAMGSDEDIDIIQLAKAYGTIPLLHLATISIQGDIDIETTHEILTNEEYQNRLFNKMLRIVRAKGYYGINISAQYINASNQTLFYNYAQKLSDRLHQEGLLCVITINPKVEILGNEIVYEKIDYSNIGIHMGASLCKRNLQCQLHYNRLSDQSCKRGWRSNRI